MPLDDRKTYPPHFENLGQALEVLFHGGDAMSHGEAPRPQFIPPSDPLNPHADPQDQQIFYDNLARAAAANYLAKQVEHTALAEPFHEEARNLADVNRNYFHAGNTPQVMTDADHVVGEDGTIWERSNWGTHVMNAVGANHHYGDADGDGTQSMWGKDVTLDSYRGTGPRTEAMSAHRDMVTYMELLQSGQENPYAPSDVKLGLNPSYDPDTRERETASGSADIASPDSSHRAHFLLDVVPAFPNAGPFVDYESRHSPSDPTPGSDSAANWLGRVVALAPHAQIGEHPAMICEPADDHASAGLSTTHHGGEKALDHGHGIGNHVSVGTGTGTTLGGGNSGSHDSGGSGHGDGGGSSNSGHSGSDGGHSSGASDAGHGS